MSGARRLEASFAASALLHALVLGVVLRGARVTLRPPLVAIPVALVGAVGGGGGAASPASEPAPPPAPAPPAPQAKPRPRPAAVARRPTREPASPPESAAPAGGAEGDGFAAARGGTGGGDGSGGDGSGGDGSGGARVAYGTNPLPPYPLVARRLGKEGVVLLEVLVSADGRAVDVSVRESSGFAALD